MAKLTYVESVQKGIEHLYECGGLTVGKHREIGLETLNRRLNLIADKAGDSCACIQGLSNHAKATALLAWFESHDLAAFKQWAYVSGKLDCLARRRQPDWLRDYQLLMPLLSDHAGLIDWFAHHEDGHDPRYYEQVGHFADFHSYQIMLALRGEWAPLIERSERALVETTARHKRFLLDYRFYIALARGDVPAMEACLAELTSPKVAKVRNHEFEFGLTEHFISTYGVIFAKIAWRHGYRIQVDTPFIPAEWLPISPLTTYEDIYPFMAEFDCGPA